jgi:hypothetical protein
MMRVHARIRAEVNRMSQEPSPAVVEFGPASGPPDTPQVSRTPLSRLLDGARLDNRVVPALAGLGAVAVFVSLLSPWQATTVNISNFGAEDMRGVDVGITDLGGWAPAYLLGVFAIAALAMLALFGAPAARQHSRLAGIGVTGALFAMLVALAVELNRNNLTYPDYAPQQADKSVRSGLYLAFVGVAALGVALYLAGRLPAPASAEEGEPVASSLWRWRRTRNAEPDPDEPPPPADLTVMPARPFVPGPEQ